MKDKSEYLMIKKFKDDTDPEMIADIILELLNVTIKEATKKDAVLSDFYKKRSCELWKTFYEMTEYRNDDIPF